MLKKQKVVFESLRDSKFNQSLLALSQFYQRTQYWPKADSNDTEERAIGKWCQALRQRYRLGILPENRVKALLNIGFSFDAAGDRWARSFTRLQHSIDKFGNLAKCKESTQKWLRRQVTFFDKPTLDQQNLLRSIGFTPDYFDSGIRWEQSYQELKSYVAMNGELPKFSANPKLDRWFLDQRKRMASGLLTEAQVKKLRDLQLNLDLRPDNDKLWRSRYKDLVNFRKKFPGKWPSYHGVGEEKRLYHWCQAQRQIMAGTARRRKTILSLDKIEKLNKIGFYWSIEEWANIEWDRAWAQMKEFLKQNGNNQVPSKINGKSNFLYAWLLRQKKAFSDGTLTEDRISKLQQLGLI